MSKIRRSKRRGGQVEMRQFDQFFAWGYRFGPSPDEPPFADGLAADACHDAATQDAVRDAWEALGTTFMRDWP